MSLPEVRLVIAQEATAHAGRAALAGELTALAAGAAAGSKKCAEELSVLLGELHHLAGHAEPAPEASAFEAQLAGLFGQIGIQGGN